MRQARLIGIASAFKGRRCAMIETIRSMWSGITDVGNAWWFNPQGAMYITGALLALAATAYFSLRRS